MFENSTYTESGKMIDKIETGTIAYCIATLNHPDVISYVLQRIAFTYQKYGVDIYVYDSSEDDATKNVVNQFVGAGADNLCHIKIDPSVSFDEKLIMIFNGYGFKREYRYIWPIKDRTVVGEVTLNAVIREADKGYDVFFLQLPHHPYFDEEVETTLTCYEDAAEFYRQWGWGATSLDTTIFSTRTLLKSIDWNVFRERYFFDGENLFDHFTTLFYGLAQLENCSIRVIGGEHIQFHSCPLGESLWMRNAFHIWANRWLQINEALPSCYDKYKAKTIRRATTLPWILGACDNLLLLKNAGVLTQEVWENLEPKWESLSDVSTEEMHLIVNEQPAQLMKMILTKMEEALAEKNYKEAYRLYTSNTWIGPYNITENYILLGVCLEIYMFEIRSKVANTIFGGTYHYKEAFEKYRIIKSMIRRLEYDVMVGAWNEIRQYVTENKISSAMLMYVMNKTCLDKESVYQKIINVLEG